MTNLDAAVRATLARLDEQKFSRRLWERDPAIWKSAPAHQRIIKNALGWLTIPDLMRAQVSEILSFVEEVKHAGFKYAVVLGMGGSSLCPRRLPRHLRNGARLSRIACAGLDGAGERRTRREIN